jgi:RNA polymerase sigma-70 factor (ECF subfamily)
LSGANLAQPEDMHNLYNDHHGWLRGWLHKKLGCTEQAADVVQDTFVRVLQHREKTGALPDIREPRAYLSTVASRLMYDRFRRQALEKAYLESLASLPEQFSHSPEELYQIRQTLFELDKILDRLKPIVRQVFILSQLKGLTYIAIAQQLSVSERSVKRYMAMAFEECIMVME